MTYTIKEVAAMVDLSIYTLRFYDKAGLLPFVARDASGYRAFTDADVAILKTICCLKRTGMKLEDIRLYIADVMAGPDSIPDRQRLLAAHRQEVLAEQERIMQNLAEIDRKLAIYDSPMAKTVVAAELQIAQQQKAANHLPNPFVAAQ